MERTGISKNFDDLKMYLHKIWSLKKVDIMEAVSVMSKCNKSKWRDLD